jgi:hypothetical protein
MVTVYSKLKMTLNSIESPRLTANFRQALTAA